MAQADPEGSKKVLQAYIGTKATMAINGMDETPASGGRVMAAMLEIANGDTSNLYRNKEDGSYYYDATGDRKDAFKVAHPALPPSLRQQLGKANAAPGAPKRTAAMPEVVPPPAADPRYRSSGLNLPRVP